MWFERRDKHQPSRRWLFTVSGLNPCAVLMLSVLVVVACLPLVQVLRQIVRHGMG